MIGIKKEFMESVTIEANDQMSPIPYSTESHYFQAPFSRSLGNVTICEGLQKHDDIGFFLSGE